MHVVTDDGEGWGECAAPSRRRLRARHARQRPARAPRRAGAPRCSRARLRPTCAGNHFAQGRARATRCSTRGCARPGTSLARISARAARPTVDAGVAIGIADDERELRAARGGVRRRGLPEPEVQDRARRRRRRRRRGPRREVGDDVTLAGRRERELHARRRRTARRARPVRPRSASNSRSHPTRCSTTRALARTTANADRARRDASRAQASYATRSRWHACRRRQHQAGLVGGIDAARRVHDVCVAAGVAARDRRDARDRRRRAP